MTKWRSLLPLLVILLVAPLVTAEEPLKTAPDGKSVLFPETGRHRHPIATKSAEAQQWFDQGLTLYFGFNHAEAVRSFQRAAELDPKSPMPHWGIGLALGPNYNRGIDPVDEARNKAAHDAARKALALAADGPPHELAYAQALVRRYSTDPAADGAKLETDYRDALAAAAKANPDDLDLAVLYAEATLNLRPWQLWGADGKPAPGTEEAVRVLASVIRRDPDHVGANHYYIHALENSPHPERALPSADSLLKRTPWAGHLVHMPAHIYIHTGDYELAAKANELAAKADEEYFKVAPDRGLYRTMYYPHNLQFLVYARAAQGRFEAAKHAADKLATAVAPDLVHAPGMQSFAVAPLQVLLRFHKWDDILAAPRPGPKTPLVRVFWHYARTVALSAQGKAEEAAVERKAFDGHYSEIPAGAKFGVNPAGKVFAVAAAALDARLAADPAHAVKHWRQAVALQDALAYGEPPDWYYPVRESLGAALLRNGKVEEAEAVFRDELKRAPRGGRALFGLREALTARGKAREAELVGLEFERVWQRAAPLELKNY